SQRKKERKRRENNSRSRAPLGNKGKKRSVGTRKRPVSSSGQACPHRPDSVRTLGLRARSCIAALYAKRTFSRRRFSMSILWLFSMILLWIVVLFLGFLLLGALRAIGLLSWRLEQLEATTPKRLGRDGLKPGKKAPDFTLPNVDGKERSLHD